jgi:hypothetical protein
MKRISMVWHSLRNHRIVTVVRYGDPQGAMCECGRQWWFL